MWIGKCRFHPPRHIAHKYENRDCPSSKPCMQMHPGNELEQILDTRQNSSPATKIGISRNMQANTRHRSDDYRVPIFVEAASVDTCSIKLSTIRYFKSAQTWTCTACTPSPILICNITLRQSIRNRIFVLHPGSRAHLNNRVKECYSFSCDLEFCPATMNNRPIIITGSQRSGTTLLNLILDSHPQIHGVDEMQFRNNTLQQYLDTFVGSTLMLVAAQRENLASQLLDIMGDNIY